MDSGQAKNIIEALLFAAEGSLTVAQIKEVLEELDARDIKLLISELKEEYSNSRRSFNITEVAGGYQLGTVSTYALWINKLYRKSKAAKLSQSSLETLAIIAYKQPITRQEIEEVRGVSVDAVLRRLLEKSLIRISGRKQIPGKPFFYSTTKPFLEFFGLVSLSELPRMEEFESVGVELRNVSEPSREGEKEFLKDDGTEEIDAASENTPAYPQGQAADAGSCGEMPGVSKDDLARQNGDEENGEAGGITQENRPD